jgi:cyclic-di-GMP phosphodiesterase TipF (flagellum assembly factor)
MESLMRLGAIFVALCMVMIAGSAGVVAYLAFGFDMAAAVTVAIAVLIALALYNMVSTRLRAHAAVASQVTELARGTADVARQVAEMGRRLTTLESKVEGTLHPARATADPLAVELEALGTLVNSLPTPSRPMRRHLPSSADPPRGRQAGSSWRRKTCPAMAHYRPNWSSRMSPRCWP